MENLPRFLQKNKTKPNMKRLSSITQFKIEFLLLFNNCRKVLGKMPEYCGISIKQTPLGPEKSVRFMEMSTL